VEPVEVDGCQEVVEAELDDFEPGVGLHAVLGLGRGTYQLSRSGPSRRLETIRRGEFSVLRLALSV
jgi:hypothetical protein